MNLEIFDHVEIDRNSIGIGSSRSFCQLALRSSARFYASEVSKLW
ncbi:hypothetical protein SLEP1_g18762 [Rubroshorea leprosula]|uniref:Uncharacterized protein n=1 Tax=Rubroshorea leprosula TaxID=152421 RepID=A0AAV5J7K8_9ROSI|nr:hypothetical protein SLEP1_g18762 [Rubroshorea leprosula]